MCKIGNKNKLTELISSVVEDELKLKQKYGIIDIGSNTIRLVIYEQNHGGRLREIENVKTAARLSHYLNNDLELSEEGIGHLIHTLKSFRDIVHFHQLYTVKCVATAAIRQAVNQQEILRLVKEETGFIVKVLSGEEEAYYGFLAVTNTTPVTEGITVDIGGGSTEITYYCNRELLYSHSFSFGVVSLKEKFIKNEKISTEEKQELSAFIIEQLEQLPWLKNRSVPIITIGGSGRNLAQIDQQQRNYPIAGIHQYTMSGERLSELRNYMFTQSVTELEKLEGLSKDRADIILPATELFYQLFHYTNGTLFMFSRKGLRDGLLIQQLFKEKNITQIESIVDESLKDLVHDYEIREDHALKGRKIALELYNQLVYSGTIQHCEEQVEQLSRAALVYYIGQYIDHDASSQHTFYLLANRSIDGIYHKNRVKLALISSYKNKGTLKQFLTPFDGWFSKEEQWEVRLLGSIIRLAYSFITTKRNIVSEIKVEGGENEIIINVFVKGDCLAEMYQAEKQKRHLEKTIKKSVNLSFNVKNSLQK